MQSEEKSNSESKHEVEHTNKSKDSTKTEESNEDYLGDSENMESETTLDNEIEGEERADTTSRERQKKSCQTIELDAQWLTWQVAVDILHKVSFFFVFPTLETFFVFDIHIHFFVLF